jgi:hypothetical protein
MEYVPFLSSPLLSSTQCAKQLIKRSVEFFKVYVEGILHLLRVIPMVQSTWSISINGTSKFSVK